MNNKPFLLKPIYKDYLWGGQRLITEMHKETDINPCAESWEFSTHKDGISICNSGIYKGLNLKDIFMKHPEFLGKYNNSNGDAPILIKIIDAKSDLSIQVHPDDKYALKNENSLGKNEAWYLLEDGKLVIGFNKNTNKQEVLDYVNRNKIIDLMNYMDVRKGDFYPIEAGTVHVIGGGSLLVELQENSNITYRLYDYNRKDKNGNTRELHIDKCLDVLNYSKYLEPKQGELNFSSRLFKVTKSRGNFAVKTSRDNFFVLICVEGSSKASFDDENISIKYGDTIFIPSDSECLFEGNAVFLKVEV